MARKDLLKGLMSGENAAPSPAAVHSPRPTKGAIGAVSQSIADLRNRSVIDVPPDLIDHAGVRDRLDEDAEGIAELAESIREYGQQVPVLLRHSPNVEGRYDVVYGRRRVAALRLIGRPVKAMVRELSDRDLVIAQGQENAARKDLSFVEKANFARSMRDEGFDRKIICDALKIDTTLISRMLSIADTVPQALIQKIGSAPGIGRDRWAALAAKLGPRPLPELLALAIGDSSDARFEAVLIGVSRKKLTTPAPAKPVLAGAEGVRLGAVTHSPRATTFVFDKSTADGFDEWLFEHMEEIHRSWLSSREG